MYLEQIEIVGFRGISRLSLALNRSTVLVGENAWGKSSLLDALTLLLSPESELYVFAAHDFYFPPEDIMQKDHYLHIVFTFCAGGGGYQQSARYRSLSPLWVKGADNLQRIYMRFEGELAGDGAVFTWRTFLNERGEPLVLHDIDQLVRALIQIHPVLRLRDSRFVRQRHGVGNGKSVLDQQLTDRLQLLTQELVNTPQKLSSKELHDGLLAMRQLLEHYFTEHNVSHVQRQYYHDNGRDSKIWRALESLNQAIASSGNRRLRLVVMGIFSLLLQAKGSRELAVYARPLLLIEDPETRLHPIMMSVAWGLLSQLPLQRITTTNSGELLSLVPMESVCRLVRHSSKVAAYRTGQHGMSQEESRRIEFHIRFNRASSLFSRCWLLVEGETEVWLLSELARLCGYHFEAEGIKVIEFAQSGLKPLIKFAGLMGIEWHVLVDGDEAGKKYASTTRSMLSSCQDIERDRLTILPARDMEHFMYREGFRHIYHHIAAIPENAQVTVRRVIQKAIHHANKPDLAIAVAVEAVNQGGSSVPSLLKSMFSRVAWLARGRAD